MNKTKTLAAALFGAAVTLTSASAQSEKTGEAPTDFVNISGGYLFDIEEAYLYSSYVFAVDENDFFGIESMIFSKNQTLRSGGFTLDLDTDVITIGAIYQVVGELSENDFWNYSFGGGVALYDVKGRTSTGSGSDSGASYYLGGSVGYERRLSDDFSFNTNLRLVHFGDETFEDDGVKLETDFEAVYVGLEAGFTYKF